MDGEKEGEWERGRRIERCAEDEGYKGQWQGWESQGEDQREERGLRCILAY